MKGPVHRKVLDVYRADLFAPGAVLVLRQVGGGGGLVRDLFAPGAVLVLRQVGGGEWASERERTLFAPGAVLGNTQHTTLHRPPVRLLLA